MKGQIPSGKPWIFPFVRHRDDMATDHVEPFVIADPAVRPSRIDAVLLEPFVYIVKEILLAPQHSGQRLSHHIGCIVAGTSRGDRLIELVGLAPARLEDLRKAGAKWSGCRRCGLAQPQPNDGGRPGTDAQLVMRGGFCPGVVWVDRALPVCHHAVVDPVLDIGCGIGATEETLVVRLVFGEQQDRTSLAMEEIVAENRVARGDGGGAVLRGVPQRWFRLLRPPGPEVAEPQGRQYMDLSVSESAIGYADLDQHVCRRGFCVLDEYV